MTRQSLPSPQRSPPPSEIAATLASPGTVLPRRLPGATGGAGLSHWRAARPGSPCCTSSAPGPGHGDWATARAWLAEAASGNVTAASNARLFFGAPALAFVFHIAAASTGRYRPDPDRAGRRHPGRHPGRARQRPRPHGPRRTPELREFDLIRGLAGLGAYHLAAHPDHEVTRDVLACLARLTEPLPGATGRPAALVDRAPRPAGSRARTSPAATGTSACRTASARSWPSCRWPSCAASRSPAREDAARRICAWTDQWRHGGRGQARGGPASLRARQAETGRVDPGLRPRPSWCYGVAGTARAQQLAGLALRDPARRQAAEAALLAVLRDPARTSPAHRGRPVPRHRRAPAGRVADGRRRAPRATSAPRSPASPPAWPPSSPDPADDDPELLDGAAGSGARPAHRRHRHRPRTLLGRLPRPRLTRRRQP